MKKKKYDIGIPLEIKEGECRVALLPDAVRKLVKQGLRIGIEKGAGCKSGFLDTDYRQAGAKILRSKKQLWSNSSMVVKVKEPLGPELNFFYPGLKIFCFLHLAANPKLVSQLIKRKVTAFAFETYRDQDNQTPLLMPMSQIAGKLSVVLGERYLCSDQGGKGSLLSATDFTSPARVVVIGGGHVGWAAVQSSLLLGAKVSLFDIHLEPFKKYSKLFPNLSLHKPTSAILKKAISQTDLLIGAIHIPGERTKQVISKSMIQAMPQGSVFVDVAIDQGGSSETSRVTSLLEPSYECSGVIHLCIPNLPALVPNSASQALSRVIISKVSPLLSADLSQDKFYQSDLKTALNTYDGELKIDLGF